MENTNELKKKKEFEKSQKGKRGENLRERN
jgi:hypothetical protein